MRLDQNTREHLQTRAVSRPHYAQLDAAYALCQGIHRVFFLSFLRVNKAQVRLAQDAKLPAFSARSWTTVNLKEPSSSCRPCRADPLLDVRPMAVSTILDHSYTWDLLHRWSHVLLTLAAWRLRETLSTCIAAQLTGPI